MHMLCNEEGCETMYTKKITVVFPFACLLALLALTSTAVHAEESAAKQAWYKALDRCMGMKSGQRGQCERGAWQVYQMEAAREQKKDVTIRLNYDASNDKPEQAAAEKAWNEAIDRCDDLKGEQNVACMNEAWTTYQSAISQ